MGNSERSGFAGLNTTALGEIAVHRIASRSARRSLDPDPIGLERPSVRVAGCRIAQMSKVWAVSLILDEAHAAHCVDQSWRIFGFDFLT